MALAKKCDRCGNLYEVMNQTIRKQRVNGLMMIDRYLNNTDYDSCEYIDLCPKCLESFSTWLKMSFEPVFAMKDDSIHVGVAWNRAYDYVDKEESNDFGRTES